MSDDYEYWDDDRWKYEEEALSEWERKQAQERWNHYPSICRGCRWLDWYYLEDCNMRLSPIDGKCKKFCRAYKFVFWLPIPVRLWFWRVQATIWAWRTETK